MALTSPVSLPVTGSVSSPDSSPLSLAQLDGFIFDLDGTLYIGDALLPGAAQTVAELRGQGKRTLFVTNKPVDSRNTYAAKLTKLGIPAVPDDVITSAF